MLGTTKNLTMRSWGGLGSVVWTLGGEMGGIFRATVLAVVFGVGVGTVWDFAFVEGHHGKNGELI